MNHLKLKSSRSPWNALCIAMLVMMVAVSVTQPAAASETCSGNSSCQLECNCQPVCSMQLVERTVWDVVSEPICVGGCMTSCGHGSTSSDCSSWSGSTCDDCDSCAAEPLLKCRSLFPWLSKSRVRTRHRLVRKTVVDYVPVTSFIVAENVTTSCDAGCDAFCDDATITSTETPEVFWMEAREVTPPTPAKVKLDLSDVEALRSSLDVESAASSTAGHVAEVVRAPVVTSLLLDAALDKDSLSNQADVVRWVETPNRPAVADVHWLDRESDAQASQDRSEGDDAGLTVHLNETESEIYTAHRSLIDAGFDVHASELPLTAPASLPPVIRQ